MNPATHEVISELYLASNDKRTVSVVGGQLAEDILIAEDEFQAHEREKRHSRHSAHSGHSHSKIKSIKEEGEENEVENPLGIEGDKIEGNNRLSSSYSIEIDLNGKESEINSVDESLLPTVPNMWTLHYIGLYSQYAAVGLLYGMSGTLLPFCVYTYDGPTNVCANAKNIVFFAWSFKIIFAVITDSFRPFGMRRKPWMLLGWSFVLIILLVLAIIADQIDASSWLVLLLFSQGFLMLSDVPADGYCVELGKLEREEERGQILATGQRIRFTFCVVAGVIQTFLLNGPSTNDSGCPTSFENCWSWGLTINQYYGLLFVLVFILTLPILWLKELDDSHIPRHDFKHFVDGVWSTLQNLTTFYLIIFVAGSCSLSNFTSNANITLQYYVIKLTNFQAGIDTITTYGALVFAIWLFQRYLINKNWRYTQFGSTCFAALLGLIWIPAYYNEGGTRDPWFTIFIDLDTQFTQGIAQVLYSMAVIELAKPGQEATTYELIITIGNAALTLNGIISTQLLTPMKAVGCDDDYGNCPSDTVVVTSESSFVNSDGPFRFTNYAILLSGVSIAASMIFTPFLPSSKEECQTWKIEGERLGTNVARGRLALFIALVIVGYGLAAAILLLDVNTACQPEVGGSGC